MRFEHGAAPDHVLVDLSDDPSLPDVREIMAERAHRFELLEDHRVLAPYALASITLVFHVLGRTRASERKEHRSLFFTADEIVSAAPPPWDFRDRGLWISRQRFRPLAESDVAEGPMAMRDMTADLDAMTRRYRSRRYVEIRNARSYGVSAPAVIVDASCRTDAGSSNPSTNVIRGSPVAAPANSAAPTSNGSMPSSYDVPASGTSSTSSPLSVPST